MPTSRHKSGSVPCFHAACRSIENGATSKPACMSSPVFIRRRRSRLLLLCREDRNELCWGVGGRRVIGCWTTRDVSLAARSTIDSRDDSSLLPTEHRRARLMLPPLVHRRVHRSRPATSRLPPLSPPRACVRAFRRFIKTASAEFRARKLHDVMRFRRRRGITPRRISCISV